MYMYATYMSQVKSVLRWVLFSLKLIPKTISHAFYSDIDNYLLFPTGSQLRQISLDTDYLADFVLPIFNFRAASSIAVDIQTDDIYWTDTLEAKIFKVPMSGGQRIEVVTTGLIEPVSVVIDWIGRNMYWADSELGRIEVSTLDVSSRRILFSTELTHVTSLAIDLKSQ